MFRTVLANDCFVEANVKSPEQDGDLQLPDRPCHRRKAAVVSDAGGDDRYPRICDCRAVQQSAEPGFDRAVAYKLENDLTI